MWHIMPKKVDHHPFKYKCNSATVSMTSCGYIAPTAVTSHDEAEHESNA